MNASSVALLVGDERYATSRNGLRTAVAGFSGDVEGRTREVTSVTVQKCVQFGVDCDAVGVAGPRSHI